MIQLSRLALLAPLALAALLSACSNRASAPGWQDGEPLDALSIPRMDSAARIDIDRHLRALRGEYLDEDERERYFDKLLDLYKASLEGRRHDLAEYILERIAIDVRSYLAADDSDWIEGWRIRLALREIAGHVNRQELLTARQKLEDLRTRHPLASLPSHPLSIEINRARLDIAESLGLAQAGVLTAWQLLNEDASSSDRRVYHERLWSLIDTMNPLARQTLVKRSDDPNLAAFIDLVTAWRQGMHGDGERWRQLRAELPGHPALEFPVPEPLLVQERHYANPPERVALLVPLSGPLASIGQAIRDGFISSAWAQAQQLDLPLATIDVYDTTVYGDNIRYVLRQAVDGGAELIVGPLRKNLVKTAMGAGIEVPIIGLNYQSDALAPGAPPAPERRQLQMSLSDEDELWQIIMLLDRLEVSVAGVLLPDSKLGRRLKTFLDDYRALFSMRASLVIDFYNAFEFDHSNAIRRMFGLDASARRARRIESRVGLDLSYKARRRGDIDVVLAIADGQQLQSLKSQIRYQAHKPIPVIATSSSYALGKKYADELDGVYMTLMPWLTAPTQRLRELSGAWRGRYDEFSYFFTFGADAWEIVNLHRPLLDHKGLRIPIHTGTVRLDEYGRLRREYAWARYANGRAVEFDPTELKQIIDTPWVPSWKRQLQLD